MENEKVERESIYDTSHASHRGVVKNFASCHQIPAYFFRDFSEISNYIDDVACNTKQKLCDTHVIFSTEQWNAVMNRRANEKNINGEMTLE